MTYQPSIFTAQGEPMPPGPTIATETWIARRLQRPDLFAGVTTPDERRERIRQVIVDGRMAMAIAGKRAGQSAETWSDLFQRVYEQPLVGKVAA
jgi:hypothetical protein